MRARLAGAVLTYGNFEGGVPVRMTLDRADLTQPRGGALAGKVDGTLLGRPLRGTLRADSIASRSSAPAARGSGSMRTRARSARCWTGGSPSRSPIAAPTSRIRLTAQRAAELAPWLGFASNSALPVDLRGNVQVRTDRDVAARTRPPTSVARR